MPTTTDLQLPVKGPKIEGPAVDAWNNRVEVGPEEELRRQIADGLRNPRDARIIDLEAKLVERDFAPDDPQMTRVESVIKYFQDVLEKSGNSCVYVRRGGVSWGAVALNRRDDDEKNGVFDLQAQHDRDMLERLEQVKRIIASNRELEAKLAEENRQHLNYKSAAKDYFDRFTAQSALMDEAVKALEPVALEAEHPLNRHKSSDGHALVPMRDLHVARSTLTKLQAARKAND